MKTVAVLLGLMFFAQVKQETPTIDLSTPEKTVRSFLTMYAAAKKLRWKP